MEQNQVQQSQEMKIGDFTVSQLVQKYGTPLYVYNSQVIQERCQQLLAALKLLPTQTKALYACKANTNIAIIKLMKEQGIQGIDAVSIQEVLLAKKAGFEGRDIQFTENFIGQKEVEESLKEGILLCIGELDTLETLGQRLQSKKLILKETENGQKLKVAVRINPDVGVGECEHTITGGPKSKFGIYCNQIEEIIKISEKYPIEIEGIHQHIGSNMVQNHMDKYVQSIKKIFDVALQIKGLKFINIGGGIGVPYEDGVKPLDLIEAYQKIAEEYKIFKEKYGHDVEIRVEPGRFLVAESGHLLTSVTAIKKNQYSTWIGTDTGMNHLIRPALYDSYHKIENASNFKSTNNNDSQRQKVNVCGNICESGDVFGQNRLIRTVQDDDILAIYNGGAYGYCMASNYNSRNRPAEVLVNGSIDKLIRRRETLEDQLATQIFD
ncbi:hypothetical protein ABPG72_010907 [Tetrahymena utriculariae]